MATGEHRWLRRDSLALLRLRVGMPGLFGGDDEDQHHYDELARLLWDLGHRRRTGQQCKQKLIDMIDDFKLFGPEAPFAREVETLLYGGNIEQGQGELHLPPQAFHLPCRDVTPPPPPTEPAASASSSNPGAGGEEFAADLEARERKRVHASLDLNYKLE